MKRSALFLTVLCAALFALAGNAFAATYTVNSVGDAADATSGDGLCKTAGNVCTLRAAIQQVNADNGASATINFGLGIGQTITTNDPPAVTVPVTIQGCANPLTATAPCTQIDANGTNGLIFNATATVSGLALRAGPGGLNSLLWLRDGDGSAVTGNWIGMGLSGVSNDYTSTGILVTDADGATIGGTTAPARNVINGANDGLFIDGADSTSVKGNYFSNNAAGDGGAQNGNAVLRNRVNISVGTSDTDVADNTLIGAPGAFNGGSCDGACNLLSNALGYQDGTDWVKGSAIDLTENGAAGSTTIQGNFIGTDVSGANVLANHGRSAITIVGTTGDTVIGGPSASDGNVLASQVSLGNVWRGLYHDGGSNISFQHNFVGTNATGTAAFPFDIDAVVIRGTVGKTAQVRDNLIAGAGSSAITANGNGAIVAGNTVNVGVTSNTGGIRAEGANGSVTNNVIGGTTNAPAISAESANGNTITSNTIGTNAAHSIVAPVFAGIAITGNAANNTIGGPLAGDGNYIANTTHDAVVIPSSGVGNNFISSTGTNIGEQFIDVGGTGADASAWTTDTDGDGPGGNAHVANGGVGLPSVTGATSQSANGAAPTGSTVSAFETTATSGQPQDIVSGLGKSAVIGGSGLWSLTFNPVLDTHSVVALQRLANGSTGELTDATDIAADTTAPDTTIDLGPSGPVEFGGPAQFTFHSSESSSTFKCSVDGGTFTTCTSPFNTSALPVGAHSFAVQATDFNANTDPTPASQGFTVVDTVAPQTTINSGPAGPIALGGTAQFTFSSSESPSTFQCSVDGATFSSCSSPFTTLVLGVGNHTFAVRATDSSNNSDGTPATRSFSVVAPTVPTAITAPIITSAKVKGKATIKKGAKLVVGVDKAATLSVKLTQKTKKGKKKKTKTKTVSLGSLKAGSNTVKLKLKGFKPGKISAVLSAASQGVASSKTLTIKAKKK